MSRVLIIRIPDEWDSQLDSIAHDSGITKSKLVRDALVSYAGLQMPKQTMRVITSNTREKLRA